MRSLEFPSIQWGLIFGIAASVIAVITDVPLFSSDIIAVAQNQNAGALLSFTILQCGGALLMLVVLNAAGVLTSRETGTIAGGVWAGALVNLTSTIMGFVLDFIILPNTKLGQATATTVPGGAFDALSTSCVVGCGLVGLLISCAFSGLLALPGAWFGRWLYDRGSDEVEGDDYEEVPYLGAMPGVFPTMAPPGTYAQPGMPSQGPLPQPGGGGWGGPPPGYGSPPPGYGPPPGYAGPPPGYAGPPPGYAGPPPGYAGPPPGYGGPPPGYAGPPPGYAGPNSGPAARPPTQPPPTSY